MRKTKPVLLVFGALLLVAFFFREQASDPPETADANVRSGTTGPPGEGPAIAVEAREPNFVDRLRDVFASNDCIEFDAYAVSPQGRARDDWLTSWGAPAEADRNLNARPYVSVDIDSLRQMASSGEVEAMHEIAMVRIWNAYRGPGRTPDYVTWLMNSSPDYPLAAEIDYDALEEARSALYQSALNGRIYDLLQLGWSYSNEVIFLDRKEELTEEKARELRLLAYSYAKATEQIVGLGPNVIGMRMFEDMEVEAKEGVRAVVANYMEDRKATPNADVPLPTVPSFVSERVNFCE